jgi:Spy/CpxP family protein refolding chaperone
MKGTKTTPIIITLIVVVGLSFYGGYLLKGASEDNRLNKGSNQVSYTSPYSGEEIRGIKSLSQEEVKGLLAGEGTPFEGMAKLAELNGYPGPRHVLDMAEEMQLSTKQKEEVENLYKDMKEQAIPLGENIVELEKEMNDGFVSKNITSEELETKVAKSAELYGQLRFIHLKYHFLTKDILTPEQVQKYNELRGYTNGGDPCSSVPEGHDPEMWRLHNNCD